MAALKLLREMVEQVGQQKNWGKSGKFKCQGRKDTLCTLIKYAIKHFLGQINIETSYRNRVGQRDPVHLEPVGKLNFQLTAIAVVGQQFSCFSLYIRVARCRNVLKID